MKIIKNFKSLNYEMVKNLPRYHRLYLGTKKMICWGALVCLLFGGIVIFGCVSQITVVEKKQRDDHKQKEIQIDAKKDSVRNN